jgi:pimeloyl-[acyl-carrier protein] methyl ester esterase
VRHVRKIVLGSNPVVLAARARLMFTADALEQLSQIDLPVLYIRGTEDRLVSDRALRTIRDVLPSVEVSFVAAPHFILQMAPSEAWRAIEQFSEHRGLTLRSAELETSAAG